MTDLENLQKMIVGADADSHLNFGKPVDERQQQKKALYSEARTLSAPLPVGKTAKVPGVSSKKVSVTQISEERIGSMFQGCDFN